MHGHSPSNYKDISIVILLLLLLLFIFASVRFSCVLEHISYLCQACRVIYHWAISLSLYQHKMSHDMTKPAKWLCAQRRLRSAWASAQSDQSSLRAQWVAKDPSFLHADSEDSDQTGRMTRLIWVFTERTLIWLVLSCRGLDMLRD